MKVHKQGVWKKCVVCKREWNLSCKKVMAAVGYECPVCATKRRKRWRRRKNGISQ